MRFRPMQALYVSHFLIRIIRSLSDGWAQDTDRRSPRILRGPA